MENIVGEQIEEQQVIASALDGYVFMESTKKVLEIAFETETNVILYGAGGHGIKCI